MTIFLLFLLLSAFVWFVRWELPTGKEWGTEAFRLWALPSPRPGRACMSACLCGAISVLAWSPLGLTSLIIWNVGEMCKHWNSMNTTCPSQKHRTWLTLTMWGLSELKVHQLNNFGGKARESSNIKVSIYFLNMITFNMFPQYHNFSTVHICKGHTFCATAKCWRWLDICSTTRQHHHLPWIFVLLQFSQKEIFHFPQYL